MRSLRADFHRSSSILLFDLVLRRRKNQIDGGFGARVDSAWMPAGTALTAVKDAGACVGRHGVVKQQAYSSESSN